MTKYKLEYIWLDGKTARSRACAAKRLLKAFEHPPTLADLPIWGFDGSSTMQAEGKSSDCILKPVALYPDASRKDALYRSERSHAPGWHAAFHQHARHHRERPRPVDWF